MVRWRWGAGFGLIVGLALAAPAAALTRDEAVDHCINKANTYSYAQVVEGCTVLIEAGDLSSDGQATAYLLRGTARIELRDFGGAETDFTQSLALEPQENAYLARSVAYRSQEKYDLAVSDLNKAFSLNPSNALTVAERGRVRHQQEDYAGAIKDLDLAIAMDPKLVSALAWRGDAFMTSGQSDRAIADYTRVVELDPKYTDAFLNRVSVYASQQKYALAVADFTQVVTLAPTYAEGFTERGISYWALGERVRAIADHDRAAELDPEDVIKHIARCARRIIANIELETAYAACTRAVEVRAAPEIVYFHGVASLKTERWTEALTDFQDGLNRDKQRAGAYFGQGIAKLRLGQREEGEADIARAEELDPKVAETYATYGITP